MAAFDRLPLQEFDTLQPAGNTFPAGLAGDATHLYVSDVDDQRIYAYNRQTRNRDQTREFTNLIAAGNTTPAGIALNGAITMYSADAVAGKVFAFDYNTRLRDIAKDITLEEIEGSITIGGLYLVGNALYVVYTAINHVAVYDIISGRRIQNLEFTASDLPTRTTRIWGIYGNDTVIWLSSTNMKELYCYERVSKTRRPELDFTTTTYTLPEGDIWARSWRYVRKQPPSLGASQRGTNPGATRRFPTPDVPTTFGNIPIFGSGANFRRWVEERDRRTAMYSERDTFIGAGVTCYAPTDTDIHVSGLDEAGFVSTVRPRDKVGVAAITTKNTNFSSIVQLSNTGQAVGKDITNSGSIVFVLLSDRTTPTVRTLYRRL